MRFVCLQNSNNVEILIDSETNKEVYESLSQRYQEGLEEKMKGSEIVFDNVDSLYYKLHKIILK